MPIYNPAGTTVPTPVPNPVAPVVETASIYQNANERVKTIPHIEGNTWTVEYYGRVIGNMDPATLDTDIDEQTLIQFQLVKNMEIRVTQELQQYTDPQTQLSTLQGQANMYPIVIPIIGDVFLAQLGDGTWGKFAITSTERQSMFKESVWAITYTLAAYVDQDVLDDVNGKTVQTLVFDLKGINEAGGALATLSEYERNVLRVRYIQDLIDQMYEEYYKPMLRSFVYNDNAKGYIYDPYLVEFWNYILGQDNNGGHPTPHQYDIRSSIFKNEYITIWDVMQKQRREMMNRVVYGMRELTTTVFQLPYIYMTMYSAGINTIIHPYEVNGLAITSQEDEDNVPYSPYIFSDEFYDNSNTGQTVLELQVQKLIDQIIPAFNDVKPYYDNIRNLSHKERFYQIPILIALFKVSR